ncbi:MAG: hypothetical protein Aurels2KO_47740 [Aureliella sp.]
MPELNEADETTKYAIRNGVQLYTQTNGNVHVEVEGCYFRLGRTEGKFLYRLQKDGDWRAACEESYAKTQLDDASDSSTDTESVAAEAARQLLQFLIENQIVEPVSLEGGTPQTANSCTTSASGAVQGKNAASSLGDVFYKQISLGDPNALLDAIKPWMSPLFSWHCELFKLIIIALGTGAALASLPRLQSDYFLLFTPQRGLQLGAAWLLLKFFHELAHASVCKRYGGEVRNAGLALFLLVPVAFVDVTSAWRFDSKWKRLHVSLSGVATELFLAAIAAIAFQFTASPAVRVFLVDFIALATVISIACNLNPLIKFDGYYALADFTGVDNLHDKSRVYARYIGKRYLLGIQATEPELPPSHRTWIPTFAIASACFRVSVSFGLIALAASMLEGLGIVIALLGVYLFCLHPLGKLACYLATACYRGDVSLTRTAVRLGLLLGLPTILLTCIPATLIQSTPGIVQYDPPAVLRAPEDGFVREVLVTAGTAVVKGDPILRLENAELSSLLAKKEVELATVRQAVLAARWNLDASEAAAARADQASLEEQVTELKRRVAALTILAPVDGQVVARNLQELDGRYYPAGSELAAIGDDSRKRIMLVLAPQQANEFAKHSQPLVEVSISGLADLCVEVNRIESRASRSVPDESLTAIGGGTLPVIHRPSGEPELESPHIRAYAKLNSTDAIQLRCGQRCQTRLVDSSQNVASLVWQLLVDKIRNLSPI